MRGIAKQLLDPRVLVGALFIVFQYWILASPQEPLFQRSAHLMIALFLVFLWLPLKSPRLPVGVRRALDGLCLIAVAATAVYYWESISRLQSRIEDVSPVFWYDIFFGLLLVVLLLEAVRRTVGWVLVFVILAFLVYGYFGYVIPGPVGFDGLPLPTYVEVLTMTTSGILGVTTATSVRFVFYFIAFGVIYSVIGGGQLFIELAMRLVGTARGGGAKVAIIASSLFGTISGSAVANVMAIGVFTIPLMKRAGISPERAAATEAIASTGGQLMPPIMGVAAFLMAELLARPYPEIALAGVIPALAYYGALFLGVDLHARRTGGGTLSREDLESLPAVMPRIHLLVPPLLLIGCLIYGFSAQRAVMYATVACLGVAFVRRSSWFGPRDCLDMIRNIGRQTAEVAVPISAIGAIIAMAIQSNLVLKFSSGLMAASGGTLAGSLILVIVGCIVMGMGLPTVAAYAIGAVLYVPALQNLGIPTLSAHFFVMYYCVLSMVTPPVALAAYAAAGVAQTNAMRTGFAAFKMSFVAFLVPFAFVADEGILAQGSLGTILLASAGLIVPTGVWVVGLMGYFIRPLAWGDRLLLMACSFVAIVAPTASLAWIIGVGVSVAFLLINWRVPRFTSAGLLPHAPELIRRLRRVEGAE